MSLKVLLVDDERVVLRILSHTLREAGYEVALASSGEEALQSFKTDTPDLVLLDYKLPEQDGLQVLRKMKDANPEIPVVMVTAHASIAGAVQAVKQGAYDYIGKPFDEEDLVLTVRRALEAGTLREKLAGLKREVEKHFPAGEIVAESPGMRGVLNILDRVADSEASTILLLGESGVGKGLIARSIHRRGKHAEEPFLTITCTALPEPLLESELFGHVKGAFTDARTDKKGLFELADGGTVFLDEIGDLPFSLQGKLLRFLEEKTFRKVGGVRDLRVSVRIIAATNQNLEQGIEKEKFRKDLYYRLNVITVPVPPLRERKEDILPLAEKFLRDFNADLGKEVRGLSQEVQELFLNYFWPGNVRELRNVMERVILLAPHSSILPSDLPDSLRKPTTPGKISAPVEPGKEFLLPAGGVRLDEVEKNLLRQALRRTGGNFTQAASLLGLNRHQIRYRLEKYGLPVETEISLPEKP